MTLPLRERRRQETALHIQRATLELAMQNGLESVTTDEIAAASGVSTRTFFNYYPNKEAAAIGHPPDFSDSDKDALRTGTAPLADDIKWLLDRQVETLAKDEAILRMVGRILKCNEKARGILDGALSDQREDLTEVFLSRVNNRQTAAALAQTATSAIGGAIFLWEHEDNITLSAALDRVWQGVIDASWLLSGTHEKDQLY
ncbi:TetR/AcrR family transcriptional regulator [Meridianimarinicoccus aquatilis]|uniref:TetR/AcrR family transcriptional regulator n=1 Tax=Meridianimarinicoccus aquatilis TaxID=2552766 RepID=A0A4R6B3K7_9RHOB|nr:TetR/AcrR family transcriptional regulator [Fluviibacterium aquatile]TDL90875.1 TetR/AcrR family transcriptional regulator [Fluviibacterium aquatile]